MSKSALVQWLRFESRLEIAKNAGEAPESADYQWAGGAPGPEAPAMAEIAEYNGTGQFGTA